MVDQRHVSNMSDACLIRGLGLVLSAPEKEKADGQRDTGGFRKAAPHREGPT